MVLGMVGPFGDTNFGDYAMLVNNIYTIQPEEIMVFTYNGELINNLRKTYLKDYSIYPVAVKCDYEFKAIYSSSYKVEYDDEVLVPTQILRQIGNEQEIRDAIYKIDILFVCGGGYFNHIWSAKHRKGKMLSILGTMLIANEEHKKIVFGANTFGPFDESNEFYKSIFLTLNDVVYASRDNIYSIANLRQLGIESKITLLPDDLYFLHERFLDYEPNISITLPEKYMILELYCSLDEIEENIEEIKTFANSINQLYGLKVLFISLDREFGGENQGKRLEAIQNIIVWHFGNEPYRKVEDILYIVCHAQFILCQRYHLFLIGIANNIPAYQILKSVCGDKRYYYSKANGILQQVFSNQIYQERCFFAYDIIEGFHEIINNYETIKREQSKLLNYKKEIDEKQMKQARMEYIKRYLKM